jgi:Delta7-sterol 5-desaturase
MTASTLIGVASGLVLLTLCSLALGFWAERAAQRAGRRIVAIPLRDRQVRHEAIGTLLFHAVFIPAFLACLAGGYLRFSAGWLPNVLGFAVAWYGFVALYYAMHRAMHHPRLFWTHKWHHVSITTSPLTGFSMHPAEAIGWTIAMLIPALVLSHFELLGFGGWTFFLVSLWAGNIIGHANAELWPWRSTRWSTAIANPISYHSLHHLRFNGHYGFANSILDRLLGTEFSDWESVHDRARNGAPLTKRNERAQKDD